MPIFRKVATPGTMSVSSARACGFRPGSTVSPLLITMAPVGWMTSSTRNGTWDFAAISPCKSTPAESFSSGLKILSCDSLPKAVIPRTNLGPDQRRARVSA